MNLMKSNLHKNKSVRLAASALRNCLLHRNLVLSSARFDTFENEEPVFGSLASDPSSKYYENRGQEKFEKDGSNLDKEKGTFKGGGRTFHRRKTFMPNRATESSYQAIDDKHQSLKQTSKIHKSFQDEQALKKWQEFKNAHDERIEFLSQNLMVEDDEEDDFYIFSVDPNARLGDISMKSKKGKSVEKEVMNMGYVPGSRLSVKEAEEEMEFGQLSPVKDLYEDEPGDEGDIRQEKYEEAQLERRHTPAFYGFQMKKLCKERKLVEAFKILEVEMPSVNAKPDSFCYNVLINECGRAGYTKKAFQLFNQMKKRALEVQPVAYTGLFNACAESPWPTTDGLNRAHKLRKQLQEKQYPFNKTISHAMIKAFGRGGDITTAFLIVDEMLEQGLTVDAETFAFLLQACLTDKEVGFRHALMVWRKMRELRIFPSIYCYNLLIQCIGSCGAGDPTLTTQLLQGNSHPVKTAKIKETDTRNDSRKNLENIDSGIKQTTSLSEEEAKSESLKNDNAENLVTGVEVLEKKSLKAVSDEASSSEAELAVLPNLLGFKISPGTVVGLSSLDKPEDRLALLGGTVGLFGQMMKDRVKPNMKTVTLLLDSLPLNTEVEESLLQSMKNVGLTPDTQFFNMLIRRRSFRYDDKSARDVLDLIHEHLLIPDLITFGCLALGCRTLGSALDFLKDMDNAGFRPNLEIMTTLVKNSLHKDNYYYTMKLLREMRERELVPNERLLHLLEKGRGKARKAQLNMESSKVKLTSEEKRQMDYIRLFLTEYKTWLKAADIQLEDHPWDQYRYSKADAQ